MAKTMEWRKSSERLEEVFINGRMVAWLEARPYYCDRGHWWVNVNLPDIDLFDGFPRYYMSHAVARSETEAFLRWRLWKERAAEGIDERGTVQIQEI